MKRKSIDKYIKITASVIISLFIFSGCGIIAFNSPETGGETDTATPVETAPPYEVSEYEEKDVNYSEDMKKFMMELTAADYGGGSFLIATPKPALIVSDDTVSTVMSKELETRNNYIKDQYNLNISAKNVSSDIMYDEIKVAVKSVTYYADLIMIPQADLGSYATAGNIVNLASLPDFNADGKYYNASSVEAGGGNSKIYGVAGAASIDTDSLSAVFFNKTMLSSITEDDVYAMVDDSSWTWDKFIEYANAVSDGSHSVGYQNTSLYIEDLIFVSAGMKYTAVVDGDMPQIAFTAEQADPIVELIKSITGHSSKYTDNLSAISAFASGNTLFLIDKLSTMETIANSACDWGILPLPKKSAEQAGYYTLVSPEDSMVFAVVPTVSDSQKSANILAMLNIAAYGDGAEAYADEALNYYLRDNDSAATVELIVNSATYDLAYGFASTYDAVSTATYQAIRYPSNGHRSVSHYLNTYGNSFNYAMNRLFED